MDIHNYKRQLERNLEIIKDHPQISKVNKGFAFRFKDYLISEGIGAPRIGRYILDIRKLALMLNKPFDKANEQDLRKVVAEIEQSDLAPESKKCFKILIRKLYRFIRGFNKKGSYPKEVEWISIAIPKNHNKLPEELLTEEEIKEVIRKCDCLRDKTLIMTIAESGARVGEIATMQIKHVSFEEYGARLTISGKTGCRKILVINSTPYLQQWINEHPDNSNPEACLWYNSRGEGLSYTRIAAILKKAAKRAGIKKRTYLHLLRHSQATKMAPMMSEAAMKQYFGWGQSSKMVGIYIHMSGKDTDDAILRANGIKITQELNKLNMAPKKCLRCGTVNPSLGRCCTQCGLILDEEYAKEVLKKDLERSQADQIMNKLINDPEILELIKKKILS
jgi:site-specific recombinase XerD